MRIRISYVSLYIAIIIILILISKYLLKMDGTAIATAFTGVATLTAAYIAVSGVRDTIEKDRENKRKELLDNLDSKSEWRKQLLDVASKTILTTDDVFRIIASLRYLPKSKNSDDYRKNNKQHFNNATKVIFKEMYRIIGDKYRENKGKLDYPKKHNEPVKIYLSFQESEIARLYTKYLLKHHWEWNKDNYEKYKKEEERTQFCEIQKQVQDIKTQKNFEKYLNDMKRYPYKINPPK